MQHQHQREEDHCHPSSSSSNISSRVHHNHLHNPSSSSSHPKSSSSKPMTSLVYREASYQHSVRTTQPTYETVPVESNNQHVFTTSTNVVHNPYDIPTQSSPPPPAVMTTAHNIAELDTLLEDLNQTKIVGRNVHTPRVLNGHEESGVDRSSAGQVSKLVADLEYGMGSKDPGVTTRYYEETTTHEVRPQSLISSQKAVLASPKTPRTASNATRELDNLMSSLSDFKMKDKTGSVNDVNHGRHSPIRPNRLDAMLGSLQSDMNNHGVDVVSRGLCYYCKKPIFGQVVTALGKTWHPEHFTCVHCKTELGTKSFFERDGEPYCESDYHNLFSPRCAFCSQPILDKCISALDKTWHPEHFFCTVCGKQFTDDGYHEMDGKAYCRDDYFDLFAPKCAACNLPITDNYISALSSQWHPDCFVCWDCKCPFAGGSFFDYEGKPYCETHYHAKRGSLCAACHKPISGRCITAMFRKFHPEHFVCSFCLKQLNKGTFKEQNDKPYCHPCFDKLFS